MATLTSEERVLRVLQRQEPDRVPHFEWLVDRKVRSALLPESKDHNDFAVRLEHDAVLFDISFQKQPAGSGRCRSEWGYITQNTDEEHGIEVESPIQTMDDFERYAVPDVRSPWRYETIERAIRDYQGKAVIVHLNDVFSLPRYWMGMENLLMAIAVDPELVRSLVDLSVDLNIAMAQEVARRGVKIIYTGDDYAGNLGPMMSPRHFRSLFYPGLCRVMAGFKELGLYVIKHTDGNLWPIIDMIVDSGIDCLDPIDPLAGMNLAEVKARFGHRIALKGNVDCANLLTFGDPDEVFEATRTALRQGAPGGGFILSSSNSIHSAVKPENYRAMLDAWKQFRQYPINL
jgi:uroporphyrinogen decarboxylase